MTSAEIRAQLEVLHPSCYGWAMSCCRDADQAADVLQTAYAKVLTGRAVFRGSASFKTWLFGVVRWTAAEERRRHWYRDLLALRYRSHIETSPPKSSGASLVNAEPLRDSLQKLPLRQREVLHLVFYEGLTIEQAGEVMRVSLGTARTHYQRGKTALRKALSAKEEEPVNESRRRKTPAVV